MARILYLHRDPPWAGFIADDLNILSQAHDVEQVHFQYSVRSVIELLPYVRRADLVYFWWGDLTGFLGAAAAKLLGRPSVMITGGYDIAWVPEIDYGLRGKPIRKHFVPASLRLASRIIANAQTTRQQVIEDYNVDPNKVVAIPHGVNTEEISKSEVKREPLVITIGQVSAATIRRKGIDTFVNAARLIPETNFLVVGKLAMDSQVRALMDDAPPNVEFTGFVERRTLIETMQRASVVVQASAHEGFGLALAEAMLAGATPVVTDRGALQEVVGDIGRYVPYANATLTAKAIRGALQNPCPEASRSRIRDNFDLKRRAAALLKLIETMT
jgi:glycosyltransferase involved in cell wall biosynthesis